MPGQLVTVATFDLVPKARLAQNILEQAGIKSVVTDENIVAMDWLFGNAVGWVKVQVFEEEAENAVAALEEALGSNDPVDEQSLSAEAEAATPEEGAEPREPPSAPSALASEPPAPDDAPVSERDEYARRFFLAAVFGLVIPLLWFYAIYLFLNAAFGEGALSSRSRSRLINGGVCLLVGSMMAFLLLQIFGDPFP
jgi:hypothetical protein